MQENPKPLSPTRHAAHVVGCLAFAATGVLIVGAAATAMENGALHAAFAVGAFGSLLTAVTALFVHGPDVLRCRRCMYQTAKTLSSVPVAEAEPPVPPAPLTPAITGTVPKDAWWAVR